MTIRPASANDRGFLDRMLVVAADWRPDSPVRSVEQALMDPKLAHYVVGWPRSDDFGAIAENEKGESLGAAWCRTFSGEDPSYGFVSAQVPELAIGVVAHSRGEGIGRRLMVNLINQARNCGIAQLSLSVEVENPALDLYASLGFTQAASSDGSATMVLDID